jgi:hypothetical protein
MCAIGAGSPDAQLECFEIGDPVYLRSDPEEDKVWWVQSFYQVKGEAKAYISEHRTCTWPDMAVPIYDLVEIPAMMRLAIEASD